MKNKSISELAKMFTLQAYQIDLIKLMNTLSAVKN
jgi:hypothetical protein